MAKVFLSSTVDDLREYRDAARELLTRRGHVAVGVDISDGLDRQLLPASLDQIAAAGLFVLIVAKRYGPFIEAEYEHAKATHKPLFVFLLSDEPRPPLDLTESDEPFLSSFRNRLMSDGLVTLFSSVPDFAMKFDVALARWEARGPNVREQNPTIDVTLDDLPLAWRLVVGSFADPELLLHLDPSAFVAAVEKWEKNNNMDHTAPWPSRIDRVKKALDSAQTDHEASAFWLAWMRATRPAKIIAGDVHISGNAA